ncbi:MAG TPA: hypothetical protein VG757_03455 [Devosia sp.]|nr:hypothetical protein [Devosia sp.]
MNVEIDELVAQLLARGDMNDDTVAELNRMLDDWRAKKLDEHDEAYLRGLHDRIFGTPVAEPEDAAPSANRIEGLTIEDWRDRALRAEAELARLSEISQAP